jgi:hypothetical protein
MEKIVGGLFEISQTFHEGKLKKEKSKEIATGNRQ